MPQSSYVLDCDRLSITLIWIHYFFFTTHNQLTINIVDSYDTNYSILYGFKFFFLCQIWSVGLGKLQLWPCGLWKKRNGAAGAHCTQNWYGEVTVSLPRIYGDVMPPRPNTKVLFFKRKKKKKFNTINKKNYVNHFLQS